jgi:hypothetical protein
LASETPRPRKPKRWGLRTLGFLGLAAASVISSQVLAAYKNTHFVLLTFAGLVAGLVGASICSYRGIKSWEGLPKP